MSDKPKKSYLTIDYIEKQIKNGFPGVFSDYRHTVEDKMNLLGVITLLREFEAVSNKAKDQPFSTLNEQEAHQAAAEMRDELLGDFSELAYRLAYQSVPLSEFAKDEISNLKATLVVAIKAVSKQEISQEEANDFSEVVTKKFSEQEQCLEQKNKWRKILGGVLVGLGAIAILFALSAPLFLLTVIGGAGVIFLATGGIWGGFAAIGGGVASFMSRSSEQDRFASLKNLHGRVDSFASSAGLFVKPNQVTTDQPETSVADDVVKLELTK